MRSSQDAPHFLVRGFPVRTRDRDTMPGKRRRARKAVLGESYETSVGCVADPGTVVEHAVLGESCETTVCCVADPGTVVEHAVFRESCETSVGRVADPGTVVEHAVLGESYETSVGCVADPGTVVEHAVLGESYETSVGRVADAKVSGTGQGVQLGKKYETSAISEGSSISSVSTQKAASSPADHKCSVCLELFTEPKILPCCHTFCLECLKKTASGGKTEGQITCPKCRQSHPIPAGCLSEFLTDFIASCEVEAAGLNVPTKRDDTQVCGECGQNDPISHFCTECQKYLCSVCGLDLHKRLKIYNGHNVSPIAQIDAATLQSCRMHYCTLHATEVLKIYCETCEKLVCRDCILVDHREHSYKFVQDARKLVETEMASLKSDVEKKLYPLKRNLCEIIKVETAVAGYPGVLKADINSFFDNLVRSIEARRSTLLHEAEHVCQKDAKQVWADKEYHETMLAHYFSRFWSC